MKFKIKPYITLIIKKVIIGLGWYSNENYCFFEAQFFSYFKKSHLTILHLQVLKICFSIILDITKENK